MPTHPPEPTETAREDIVSLVGKRTRALRAQQGMTRRALSERAAISERYLALLEKGSGNVSIMLLDRIAHALGAKLVDLLGETDPTD